MRAVGPSRSKEWALLPGRRGAGVPDVRDQGRGERHRPGSGQYITDNFGEDNWTIGLFWIILIPGLTILVLHATKRPSLVAQSTRPILASAAVSDSH